MKLKKVDAPVLSAREGEVQFPSSYRYNGGTIIDGEWYDGYEVGDPIVPAGFKLVGLGVGLQLNAHPPLATQRLVKT